MFTRYRCQLSFSCGTPLSRRWTDYLRATSPENSNRTPTTISFLVCPSVIIPAVAELPLYAVSQWAARRRPVARYASDIPDEDFPCLTTLGITIEELSTWMINDIERVTEAGKEVGHLVVFRESTPAEILDKVQHKQSHFTAMGARLICSGQLIPDTKLSFSSATAGANPSLN